METLGTARLIEEIDPRRAVAVTVPREEIETILRDPEAQPELQLHLRGGEEPSRINMEWSRDELEELFDRAGGDSVFLTFDRDELVDAFSDVEAHGLRQKALIFTVAATSAVGTGAGIANAAIPANFAGGGGMPAATATAPESLTDVSSTGGYVTPAAATDDTAATMATDVSSAAGYGTPAAATDQGAGPVQTDVSSTAGYGTTADTSSGSTWSIGSDATDAFLVGGVLLTIAGATFASRRIRPAQPA
jgi:hypothetical protein